MNYFNQIVSLRKDDPYRAYKIYDMVYKSNLRYYALKIYGPRYEDALDAAYRHILENFDETRGDLEHYATTVIGTINLSQYKKEVYYDEALEIAADKEAFSKNNNDPLDVVLSREELTPSKELGNCIKELLPYFVIDYKFFITRKLSYRTLDYSEIYNKYSTKTFFTAINYAVEKYSACVGEIYDLKHKVKFRNYSEDRYKKSLVEGVEYVCEYNGIILYKKSEGKSSKVMYECNLEGILSNVLKKFYCEGGSLRRSVGGCVVYISLSGQLICDDVEALRGQLERELVGVLLSRMQGIGVLSYEKGKKLLLVSSSSISIPVVCIDVLDDQVVMQLEMKVSKCIE